LESWPWSLGGRQDRFTLPAVRRLFDCRPGGENDLTSHACLRQWGQPGTTSLGRE
jgi:hypothetical protein